MTERFALKVHPDSDCEAIESIQVIIGRRPGEVTLRYVVTGAMGDLLIPPAAQPARTAGLWQHTCFEMFSRAGPAESYDEFNFAPSRQWAAYRFSAYREGMRLLEAATPRIETFATPDRYELTATLEMTGPRRLALSAVIEETNGRKSYWALAHPPGKADFHHPDSFVHELP